MPVSVAGDSRVSQVDGTFTIPGLPSSVGGNTITVRVEDVSGNVATQSVQFTKQNLNGSGFYGYDGNGNQTNEIVWTDGAAVTNVYSYDLENRLVKATSNGVTVLECWYDAIGRRIAKREILGGATNAVQYVWEGWSILAVLDETGSLLESYTRGVGVAYDVGSLVAVRHHSGTHSGSTYYLHHNHRGDVTAVRSAATTTTTATYAYTAYGEVAGITGSYESRFGFSSKEQDEATGLQYFGFRYYVPVGGRWTTRDPIGLAGGLNLYEFCRNNPAFWADAYGQECVTVTVTVGYILGKVAIETGVGAVSGYIFSGGDWRGAVAGGAGGFVGGLNPVAGPIGAATGALGNMVSYTVGSVLEPGPTPWGEGFWLAGLGASGVIGGVAGFYDVDSLTSGAISALVGTYLGAAEELLDGLDMIEDSLDERRTQAPQESD